MGFFRQGYWSGLPLLTPGDLLDPSLPHRQAGSSLLSHLGIPSDGTELHCVSPDVLYWGHSNANVRCQKCMAGDFPGGPVKVLPVNVGDTGSIPGQGRFHVPWRNQAYVPQLLRLCDKPWCIQLWSSPAAATETLVPKAHAPQQEKPPRWEARAPRLESSLLSPQLEKGCWQQQRPTTTINR